MLFVGVVIRWLLMVGMVSGGLSVRLIVCLVCVVGVRVS